MEYRKSSHAVFLLTYHMVFVTKYRKPVITEEIGDFMKPLAAYLCSGLGGELISAETDCDHIHLLVALPPDVAPVTAVRSLKTQLSKQVRSEFTEEVTKSIWGSSFWSDSYFLATTGSVSLETVKKYIEGQHTDAHKRKYVKSGKYRKKKSDSSHGQT